MGFQHALLAFFLWVTYSPGALALPSHTCIICIILLSMFCLLRLSFVTLHSLLTPCNADYLLVLRCIFFFRFLTLRGIALWSCVNSLLPCNNFFLLCTTFLFCMHILLFFFLCYNICIFFLTKCTDIFFCSMRSIPYLQANTLFSFPWAILFSCATPYFLSCTTLYFLSCTYAPYSSLSYTVSFVVLRIIFFLALRIRFYSCPAQCYIFFWAALYFFYFCPARYSFPCFIIALRNAIYLLSPLLIYSLPCTISFYFYYMRHSLFIALPHIFTFLMPFIPCDCVPIRFFLYGHETCDSPVLYIAPLLVCPLHFRAYYCPYSSGIFFMSCALALLCIILVTHFFFHGLTCNLF